MRISTTEHKREEITLSHDELRSAVLLFLRQGKNTSESHEICTQYKDYSLVHSRDDITGRPRLSLVKRTDKKSETGSAE